MRVSLFLNFCGINIEFFTTCNSVFLFWPETDNFSSCRNASVYVHGIEVDSCHVTSSDSPCGGCVVGQERRAVALPSEAVSGLEVGGDHGLRLSLGFALLRHGPVPLTPSLLQPASSKTPFLQVDPAQLVVYGWVVEKVQSQQHHHKEAVDPHTDQGCIITARDADWEN